MIYFIIISLVAYFTSKYIVDKERLYTYIIVFLIITPITFFILYLEIIKIQKKHK